MKASDLRIGNFVQYANDERVFVNLIGKTLEVTACDIFNIEKDGIPFEPIFLTEEWVKKFGFVGVGNHYEKNCFNIYKYKDGMEIELRNDEDDELFVIGMRCNCVHKLQNLYFAITGEELIIKNESL